MADYTVTAANVLASSNAVYVTGTPIAGANLTQCQPVYQDPTDNTWKPAKANGAAPLYKVAAVTLSAASTGQPVHLITYDPSFVPGFTIAVHEVAIVSGNAGKLAPIADDATGWYQSVVMIGIGTNKAILNITRTDAAKP